MARNVALILTGVVIPLAAKGTATYDLMLPTSHNLAYLWGCINSGPASLTGDNTSILPSNCNPTTYPLVPTPPFHHPPPALTVPTQRSLCLHSFHCALSELTEPLSTHSALLYSQCHSTHNVSVLTVTPNTYNAPQSSQ